MPDEYWKNRPGMSNQPEVKRFKPWSDCPIGTAAYASGGGYWHKTDRGWQWTQNGSIFPTPGADVLRVVEPKAQ